MKTRRTPAFAALRRGRQNLLAAALVGVVAFTSASTHAQDPLASWNDGPAKQAIVEFVKATTTHGSPSGRAARGAYRHIRSGRHSLGRASDVLASHILPGSRAGSGQSPAGTCQQGTLQDCALRQP